MKRFGVVLSIFLILALSVVTTSNVSAVSDITYTIDSSNYTSSYTLCSSNCSSYRYLIINPKNFFTSNHNSWYSSFVFNIVWNHNTGGYGSTLGLYGFPNYSVISLSPPRQFEGSYLYSLSFSSFYNSISVDSLTSGWSVDITLSENNPAGGVIPEGTLDITTNGTFDVSNYAQVDVEVEESSFIVQLFSKGFWGVATALVTIIVPIIALFLIFRLVHDLLWGKG